MDSNHAGTWFDLIRHGEPEGGPRYRGTLDDPLSELGWRQMREAIHSAEPWDCVLTSPLRRCREFATEVAHARALELIESPGLAEMSFGDWEGLTGAAIQQRMPGRLEAFWSDPIANPPPNGEAMDAFHERVTRTWAHWRDQLEGRRVLVVAHGGVIRMVLAGIMQTPLEKAMGAVMVPYACRSRIRMDRMGEQWLSALVAHGRHETV